MYCIFIYDDVVSEGISRQIDVALYWYLIVCDGDVLEVCTVLCNYVECIQTLQCNYCDIRYVLCSTGIPFVCMFVLCMYICIASVYVFIYLCYILFMDVCYRK